MQLTNNRLQRAIDEQSKVIDNLNRDMVASMNDNQLMICLEITNLKREVDEIKLESQEKQVC